MAFVISETNHTEAWLLTLEHSNPACTQRFRSFGFKPARRSRPALVGSSKWRIEVNDLKVGDLVRYKAPWAHRGLVTKINAGEATVFWFATGQSTSPPEGSLIKVEDRGD